MSIQYDICGSTRRTEWLYPGVGAGKSFHLRDGEQRISNREWCLREVAWLAQKGINAQMRWNADGHVAVFVANEYTSYRIDVEESYEYDPTAGSTSGGGHCPAPVQEPELPDIESM